LKTRSITNAARAATLGAAAAIGLALTPGIAQAATSSCSVSYGSSGCTSGVVAADSDHYIYYSVRGGLFCAQADFEVIDAGNGAIVKRRHVGAGVASGYVYGLYGRYYLRIYNSCGGAAGKIEN
jgi:hypothetical protein